MKFAHAGVILAIVLICIFTYFLFFREEAGLNLNVTTTTTTIPETTTTTTQPETFSPITIIRGENEILIYSDRFDPSTVTITLGEEIKWTNKDSKDHVIVLSNPPIEKSVLAGNSFTYLFTSVGTVEFTDKDTGIKGSVTVS
jgi:plastocyanin